jgi:hypothetical protein
MFPSLTSVVYIVFPAMNAYPSSAAYTAVESLDGMNKWYCPRCKTHVPAVKKIEIWKLPPVLIVHWKRFETTSDESNRSENEKENHEKDEAKDKDNDPRTERPRDNGAGDGGCDKNYSSRSNGRGMRMNKIDRRIEAPLVNLDMSSSVKSPVTPGKPRNVYELYAVLNHSGG